MDKKMQDVEAEPEIKKTPKRQGCFLLLGPPMMLTFIAYALAGIVFTDLVVYYTCLVSLQINSTECLMLRTNSGSPEAMVLEAKVETYASTIVMAKSLIESLLPALVCLFLGPWSDRGGRKPLLLAASGGCTLTYAVLSLMCNWNTSPWYLLLALIPAGVMGGVPTVRLASVCYISDTILEEDRTLQLALLESSVWVGIVLGGLSGPPIYENYGYIWIFGTAAVCHGIALAYIYFRIPETVQASSRESMRGLLKISFVKELFTSAFMKRERFHRFIIWLSMLILILNDLIFQSEIAAAEFLFTRTRLGWDVERYSYFVVADSVLRIAGLCTVFLRSRMPGLTDTLLATVALVSSLCSAITRSLTWKDWHMYLSAFIGVLNQIVVPAMQFIISEFVPAQEIGKVFSLCTLLEVLGLLAGTPLYTLIYSHYLPPIYPSPVYLFSTSLWLLLILCIVCIEVLIGKSRQKSTYISTAQEDF